MAVERHDPTFMNAFRLGAWALCSCGWKSRTYIGVQGAVIAHGEHLVKQRPGPVRPQDVRIACPDGSKIPVELAYRGVDPEGVHVWDAITPLHHGDRLLIGMLPGNTAIAFPDSDGAAP